MIMKIKYAHINSTFKKALLLSISVILFATSCMKDDGYSLNKFWIDYGMIQKQGSSVTIKTDNGSVLFPSATAIHLDELKDSMRVLVNYTILGDVKKPSDIDYHVRINAMREILKKNIFILTPETADSIGNDGVRVNNVWMTPEYDLLNIEFSYPGSPYYKHMINLTIDNTHSTDQEGNIILELRHNKKGDPYTSPLMDAAVSFNLKSIRKEGVDQVGFRLKAKGINGVEDYNKTGIYKYTTIQPK